MAKRAAKQQANSPEQSWGDTLRAAIIADGRSRYAICQATRNDEAEPVQQSVLARFMAGSSINLTTAERLGRVVGLTISAE